GMVSRVSFIMIFLGAIFFLVSDTALAIDKFAKSYAYSGIIIMSTYMLAQYYITRGALEKE
ncbi:MAG: lysoplasmalogenase family protein, partial [Saprospiraceae bacterium]